MKKLTAWCLLALLSLCGPLQAQQATGETEKSITALENQWLQGQKTNNPGLYAPLLADRFVSTGMDGKLSNKEELQAAEKQRKYSSVEYDDVRVTVYGNTAIATGAYKGKGTDAAGKPFDEQGRWTDTWVKMPNGKWQCVADHNSPLSK